MFYKIIKSTVLLVLIAFVFSACSLPVKQKIEEAPLVTIPKDLELKPLDFTKTGKLKKFKDYSELNTFLATNVIESYSETVKTDSETVKTELQASLVLDYFKDNNSDNPREADILKQNQNFSFALVKNELTILRLSDLDSSLLAKINFDSRPSGILSFGSSLVVYGDDEIINKRESSNFQFVQVFDLSTPASPKKIYDLSFEGDLKNIFIENGQLYVLTEKKAPSKLAEQSLPKVLNTGKALALKCDGIESCFTPEVFYFDTNYRAARFFNINVVDLANEFSPLKGQSYLLSENHEVYSSEASIFISYFETLDEEPFYFAAQTEVLSSLLTDAEKDKIKEVEALSDFVLSQREKMLKMSAIFESHLSSLKEVEKTLLEVDIKDTANEKIAGAKVSNKTLIHKIRLSKSGLDYYAMGEVTGKIMNNYSVLQKGSYVYLATRNSERLNEEGEKQYYSSVYVLDLALRPLSKMENLSSKEEIYGVRFLGNRAFLVSAKENGPLFVIDFKDKAKPVFSGTLKVPGNNVYLKPIDENGDRFISLSYNLDSSSGTELRNGIKLSLFDFSNLKSPRELDSYLISDANSDSLTFTDKRSLYYSQELKTLIFPATFKENNRLHFSGLFAFIVNGDALELKGKLDHSLGGFYNQVDSFKNLTYFDNSVKRSFANKNFIYSFSNKFFRSANIDDIDNAKSLELIIHSDDLLVSSFGVGNPEGLGVNENVVEDSNIDKNLDGLGQDEAYDKEGNLLVPEYFKDPIFENESIYEPGMSSGPGVNDSGSLIDSGFEEAELFEDPAITL